MVALLLHGYVSIACAPALVQRNRRVVRSSLHKMGDGIQLYDLKRPSQEEFAKMGGESRTSSWAIPAQQFYEIRPQ
jgi:hypothetical protein